MTNSNHMTNRSAFTLIEVMLAVVILGIGMTMAATMFPVGLEMIREPLQSASVAPIFEAARAALVLRVPAQSKLSDDGLPSDTNKPPDPGSAFVMVPQMVTLPNFTQPSETGSFGGTWGVEYAGIEDNGETTTVEATLLAGMESMPTPPPANQSNPWPAWEAAYDTGEMDMLQDWDWTPLIPAPYFPASGTGDGRWRVFTEASFWDALVVELSTEFSWPVPMTTLEEPDTMGGPFVMALERAPYPNTASKAGGHKTGGFAPRIHLADRVYPPVRISSDSLGNYVRPDGYVFQNVQELNDHVIKEAADRRYCWAAVHHRFVDSNTDKTLRATIVVLHRSDPDALFVRQLDQNPGSTPPETERTFAVNGDDEASLRLPEPDLSAKGTLFPTPWLVQFDGIYPNQGVVRATAQVNRLLPIGSYFVMARTPVISGSPYYVGSSIEILDKEYDEEDDMWNLKITPSNNGDMESTVQEPVLAWVFPPPYDLASASFGERSPVVVRPEVVSLTPDEY